MVRFKTKRTKYGILNIIIFPVTESPILEYWYSKEMRESAPEPTTDLDREIVNILCVYSVRLCVFLCPCDSLKVCV